MSYQRSQVYHALWQTFSYHNDGDPRRHNMPMRFARRLMKMQEFGVPGAVAERPGSGADVVYSEYDAFELGVVMTLQDGGMAKQAELAFLIRNIRPTLRDEHARIMADPPDIRQWTPAKPGQPALMLLPGDDPNGRVPRTLDSARYLTFRMIEIDEARNDMKFEGSDWTGIAPHPHIQAPLFLSEIGLFREIRKLAHSGDRTPFHAVVELSNIAVAVAHYLPQAPAKRRGRP